MALLPLRRDTASGDTLCVTLSSSSRDESGSAPMVPTACVSRGLHGMAVVSDVFLALNEADSPRKAGHVKSRSQGKGCF